MSLIVPKQSKALSKKLKEAYEQAYADGDEARYLLLRDAYGYVCDTHNILSVIQGKLSIITATIRSNYNL